MKYYNQTRRLGIDIDGVICDTLGAAQVLGFSGFELDIMPTMANWNSTNPKVNDYLTYLLYHKPEFYECPLPIPGAVRGVRQLLNSDQFQEVHYVTARCKGLETITKDWLRRWRFPRMSVYHLGDQDKADWASFWGITDFVDDKPKIIQKMLTLGMNAWLFANHDLPRVYTPTWQKPNLVRNWPDLVQHLMETAGRKRNLK